MHEKDKINNPASRLRIILDKIHGSESRTALEVWKEVFDISDVYSESGLMNVTLKLAALRSLFNQTLSVLEDIPNLDEDLYIKPIRQLGRVVHWQIFSESYFNHLCSDFSSFRTFINEADLTALKFAENVILLSGQFTEREISEGEIQAILDDLDKLYSSLEISKISVSLKNSLLELILEMRQGISEYGIRGADALDRALAKSYGVIAINMEEIEKNEETSEIQSLKKVIERIRNANNFATSKKRVPLLSAASGILALLGE